MNYSKCQPEKYLVGTKHSEAEQLSPKIQKSSYIHTPKLGGGGELCARKTFEGKHIYIFLTILLQSTMIITGRGVIFNFYQFFIGVYKLSHKNCYYTETVILQGSRWISKWPIILCTFPVMIHKVL